MFASTSGDTWRAWVEQGGALLDLLPAGLAVIDGRGGFRVLNQTGRILLGLHPSAPSQAPRAEILLPRDVAAAVREGVGSCHGKSWPTHSQREVRLATGLRLLNLTFLPGTDGQVAVFVTDATAERDAVRGDERFRKVFTDSPSGMAVVAADGAWLQVNPELAAMMGVPEQCLLGALGRKFVHADDLPGFQRTLRAARESGRASSHLRMVRRDAGTVNVELVASRVISGLGGEHYFVVHFRDFPAAEATAPSTAPRKTIVVVDDEPATAGIIGDILRDDDVEVFVTVDPTEALERIAKDASVALLVTDLLMPTMSGEDLVAKARVGRPALKVLCISGFTPRLPAPAEPDPNTMWLPKPFDAVDLIQAARRAMGGAVRRRSTGHGTGRSVAASFP